MYENKVWTLTDLPDDWWAIEIKWIFKRKTDSDSSVTIYKARLVGKRFLTKFKVLTTMRFSHSHRCLKVCPNHVSSCRIMKSVKWISKLHSLMDLLKKSCIWCNQKVLSILKVLTKCASSSDPSMDWCKASRSWNIRFDESIKAYRFIQTCGEACIYKKVSGSTAVFW